MTFHDAGDVHTGGWDDHYADRHADEDRAYDPRDVAGSYDELATANLTRPELDALMVLDRGMAARSTRTIDDPGRWTRCVQGRAANRLVVLGLARDVHQWHAVEITPAGRAALAGR